MHGTVDPFWNLEDLEQVETDAGIPSYKIDMHKRGFEDVFLEHKIDAVIHIGRIFAHEQTRMNRYNANDAPRPPRPPRPPRVPGADGVPVTNVDAAAAPDGPAPNSLRPEAPAPRD